MDWIIALVALTAMEIVLGIDNIVFIAVVTDKLPVEQQPLARRLGLALAMISRIILLLTLKWIIGLDEPIFLLTQLGIPESWFGHGESAAEVEHIATVIGVSWRDLILLTGGLFLIAKSVREIHEKLEHVGGEPVIKVKLTFTGAIFQIAVLDIIFSLDSVITAGGMVDQLPVMIAAIVIAIIVMMVFAESVSAFVARNPTIKMLALSFLILIGVMLVAEGIGTEIDKGYIYFAMAFSLIVEMLNMRLRGKEATVAAT